MPPDRAAGFAEINLLGEKNFSKNLYKICAEFQRYLLVPKWLIMGCSPYAIVKRNPAGDKTCRVIIRVLDALKLVLSIAHFFRFMQIYERLIKPNPALRGHNILLHSIVLAA